MDRTNAERQRRYIQRLKEAASANEVARLKRKIARLEATIAELRAKLAERPRPKLRRGSRGKPKSTAVDDADADAFWGMSSKSGAAKR